MLQPRKQITQDNIDQLLTASGWIIQNKFSISIYADKDVIVSILEQASEEEILN